MPRKVILTTHTVALVRVVETSDSNSMGRARVPTTVLSDLRCRIQPLSASVVVNYRQRDMDVSHAVYIHPDEYNRFAGEITEEHHFTYQSRTLQVRGNVNFDELGRYYRIDCDETGSEDN